MLELLIDTTLDSLKLLPFLFGTYLVIELVNKKISDKTINSIKKTNRFGPLIGSFLGIIPGCGLAVAAANFYPKRIITLGSLISIFLVTTDAMIPILIANGASIYIILKIITIQVIIGFIAGTIIDFTLRKKQIINLTGYEEKQCNKQTNILKSATIHTLNIFYFIFVISLALNILIASIGLDVLRGLLMQESIFGPFLASIIGLIPNCTSSVLITELYLSNTITFGSTIAGLLSGASVGLLVLFRVNKDLKENLKIVTILVTIGTISGIIIDLFNI